MVIASAQGSGPITGPLGCLFLVVGALFILLAIGSATAGGGASSWISTPCQIISSDASITLNRRVKFSVIYRYQYQGKTYMGDLVTLTTDSRSEEERQRAVDPRTYSVGTTMTCYVNPLNPSESALRDEVNVTVFLWLTGPGAILVGALLCRHARSSRRPTAT